MRSIHSFDDGGHRDRIGAVEPAAAVDGKSDTGTLDLPAAGFAPQLLAQFHHLSAARGAERMATAEQTAAGVHRRLAADVRFAFAHQVMSFAFFTQTDLRILKQFRGRCRVVQSDETEAIRSDSR